MTPRAWSYGLLFVGIAWVALIVCMIGLAVLVTLLWPAQTVGVEAWHDSAVPQGAFVNIGKEVRLVRGPEPSPVLVTPGWRPPSGALTSRAGITEPSARPLSMTGIASWYAAPIGVSAAGPRLRSALGPGWRGSTVTVCAGRRCVSVVLTGFMRRADRLIDLAASDFARLAPLSQGLTEVTISW